MTVISRHPLGSLNSVPEIARALRDIETERLQILNALNVLLTNSPAGQLLVPFTDEDGDVEMYRLVAGAGVTITFNTVAKTCTLTSP